MTISEALRRFRIRFKLKQEDVASVLGLTRQAYYFYETGKANPPSQKIVDLANAYNVSADYLLGRSDEPYPLNFDNETLSLLKVLQAWKDSKSVEETPKAATA